MATRKPSRQASSRSRSRRGSFLPFVLGVLVTAAVAAAAVFYFHIRVPGFSPRPRAIAKSIVPPAAPSQSKSKSDSDSDSDDLPKPVRPTAPPATAPRPPFPISEDVFEAGATTYVKPAGGVSCATCHGSPNRPGAKLEAIRPGAAQFFLPHSDVTRSPSQLFLRTKFGVPGAPAMPAYADKLTDTQIWQIALLLSHAAEPLPDPVVHILNRHH